MIVKLRSTAEKREILVKDLFKIEFTDVPESLFDPRKLTSYQPSSKSGILPYITAPSIDAVSETQSVPGPPQQACGLVVDLSIETRAMTSIFNI